MITFKRICSLVLCFSLCFSLMACGSSSESNDINTESDNIEENDNSTEASEEVIEEEKDSVGFEYSITDRSDEEVADLLLKISNGFYEGISTSDWYKIIGVKSGSDILDISYRYNGKDLGEWPLEDNIEKITLYNMAEKNGNIGIVEEDSRDTELYIGVTFSDESRATNIYNLVCDKLKAEVPTGTFEDLSDEDTLQTDCYLNNSDCWCVHRGLHYTDSIKYIDGDAGYMLEVHIYEEYFKR